MIRCFTKAYRWDPIYIYLYIIYIYNIYIYILYILFIYNINKMVNLFPQERTSLLVDLAEEFMTAI